MGGDLRAKRVHAAWGGAMLISDNLDYDPNIVCGADRDGFKKYRPGRLVAQLVVRELRN